jgi:hypothetical protein
VKAAVQQSYALVGEAPANGEKGARRSTVPLVNVPPAGAADCRPAAPMFDVPA